MARTLKEEEYTERRNEILDAAQRLIYTKGYEQMTIQDIQSALGISKGAFYHYFDAKSTLLTAMVERMMQSIDQLMQPLLADESLGALAKFERFFDTTARWKAAQKDYLLPLLGIWYADENAIVRQKLMDTGYQWLAPHLAVIIAQGVREGVMDVPAPAAVSQVLVGLLENMGTSIARSLLELGENSTAEQRREFLRQMQETVDAHTRAIERVLGAPAGSLCLIEIDTLQEWIVPAIEPPQA